MSMLAHEGVEPIDAGRASSSEKPAPERRPVRVPALVTTPIADYAAIGNARCTALVSRAGSIDWLCVPRPDSPSVFAALLDKRGGRFRVGPPAGHTTNSTRRYLPDTNVLETTFTTPTGVARLTDFMPVTDEATKKRELTPDHAVVRIIECIEGRIEIEVAYEPRPDYARVTPRLEKHGKLGWFYAHGPQTMVIRSEIPLKPTSDADALLGRCTLAAGERRRLALAFTQDGPAFVPALGEWADHQLAETTLWWKRWIGGCTYQGPYADAVRRSALALKLMTYAPSGAVIAAPTTSLPEKLGGVRNWDYRYCWLRDSSLTLQALFDLGFEDEASAFMSWLLHATRLTWPQLRNAYDVFGRVDLTEHRLDHLEGYARSRPVRIGNQAERQFQLDTYGEVIDAAFHFVRRGGRIDRNTARMLRGFGETVIRRWTEPDDGIWEQRGERDQRTYSKVMCWVALDRLIRLESMGVLELPVAAFDSYRKRIREAIDADALNPTLGAYVSVFGGLEPDASLLLLAHYGYVDANDPKMRRTAELVRERLGNGPLLYRYRPDSPADGLPPGEGAFGICSFWGVETRAMQGELGEAMADFETLLGYSNDVGLFAEQIDPRTGDPLGNFPQAFTHVGLIRAALAMSDCERRGSIPHPGAEAALRRVAGDRR